MELVIRVALGLTLLWAAGAKLARPRRALAGAAALSVPAGLRAPAVGVAILAETALGAALVAGLRSRPVAAAVIGIGLLFAGLLLVARLRGATRLACGCFGGASERPTLLLLARALALAALAGLLLLEPPDPSATVALAGGVVLLAVAVVALAVLVLALYRQVGVLERRLGPRAALEIAEEGPALGAPAPPLSGLARSGSELVAFGTAGCRLCAELEPGLRALARDGLPVHRVEEGTRGRVFLRWSVPGTPYAVYVEDGVVRAKGLVNTLEQLEGLIGVGRARVRDAA